MKISHQRVSSPRERPAHENARPLEKKPQKLDLAAAHSHSRDIFEKKLTDRSPEAKPDLKAMKAELERANQSRGFWERFLDFFRKPTDSHYKRLRSEIGAHSLVADWDAQIANISKEGGLGQKKMGFAKLEADMKAATAGAHTPQSAAILKQAHGKLEAIRQQIKAIEQRLHSDLIAKFAVVDAGSRHVTLSAEDKETFKEVSRALIKGEKDIETKTEGTLQAKKYREATEIEENLEELKKKLETIENHMNALRLLEKPSGSQHAASLVMRAANLESDIQKIKTKYGSEITAQQEQGLAKYSHVLREIKEEIQLIAKNDQVPEKDRQVIYQDTRKQLDQMEEALKGVR